MKFFFEAVKLCSFSGRLDGGYLSLYQLLLS